LSAGRRVLLVHLLAHPGPLPLHPGRAAPDVPRGEAAARRRPGRGLGARGRQPPAGEGLQVRPRQGRVGAGQLGRGHRDDRGGPRAHHQEVGSGPGRRILTDPCHVDGVARLGRPVREPHWRVDAELLRLVRRPAGRVPAGLRRPDRRPGVGRLVERRIPHHVGLQPAGHPYPGRALDDRGSLPRPEGHRGRTRLRRQRQVRRRVAGGEAGHGCGPRDGDGARHPHGVLRRPPDAVLHRLREQVHRPAAAGAARGGPGELDRREDVPRRQVPHGLRPARARARGERAFQDGAGRRPHRRSRGPQRLPGPSLRRRRCRTLEPRSRRSGAQALPVRRRGPPELRARAAAAFRHPRRRRERPAPRRAGAPGGRTPGDDRLRPAARPVRRRTRRPAGDLAHRVRRRLGALHARVAGRSPVFPARPPPASGASSPRTPRSLGAAR